jgi:hypothetical protein
MIRFASLAALLLLTMLPATADAGTCPTDAQGVLEKTRYRVGERLDFYGTYHDFADPGTVTITFTRPSDGATREFIAGNIADGSWMQTVRFPSNRDIGAWRVHVVVEQTDGRDECDDRFSIVPATAPGPIPTPPNTSTAPPAAKGSGSTAPWAGLAILASLALVGLGATSCINARRRRT